MNSKITYIAIILLSILACREEIDKSNRYVFTGETIADYMMKRSEKYSHMITLLKHAELFTLLQTYGQYTLFLPDNAAVEKFVAEQDSIYWTTKDSGNPIWTGVTSPLVEELSDSMANAIVRMHLMERSHRTAEFGEGAINTQNAAEKYLSVNYKVSGERFYIMIDNHSAIVAGDIEVENGIIHTIDNVINPNRNLMPVLIAQYNYFSLFSKAINATGYGDSLLEVNDATFIPEEIEYNDQGHYYGISPVYTPKEKNIRYTAFIETDDVFRSYGIETLDDLKAFAEKWYGTEESDNPRSPRNALHKFVAYHFINRELPYNILVAYNCFTHLGFDTEITMLPNHDRYDYYETMQGPLMKVIKPLSTTDARDIYINYNKKKQPYNLEMRRHLNVRVIPLTEFTELNEKYSTFNQMAENGIVHPIDKILIYNENEMHGNILNERIRLDVASLMPELSNNGIRYHTGRYVGPTKIPNGYNEALKINSGIIIYKCWHSYFSDEFMIGGNYFDISIRIPNLPHRTYEVRIGYCISSDIRKPMRYMQMYFDNKVVGLPFDFLMEGETSEIGWKEDGNTIDNGVENNKMMRNRGWMKAPDVFNGYYYGYISARYLPFHLRRIVTRQYIGAGRHWLRFRDLGGRYYDTSGNLLHLDYIEFVPMHIVSDPTKPEDRH